MDLKLRRSSSKRSCVWEIRWLLLSLRQHQCTKVTKNQLTTLPNYTKVLVYSGGASDVAITEACEQSSLVCLFFKCFWRTHIHMSFLGPLVPLFCISGDISSGFQSQSEFCFIHFCGRNRIYKLLMLLWSCDLNCLAEFWMGVTMVLRFALILQTSTFLRYLNFHYFRSN